MLSAWTYNTLYVCQHLNGIQLSSEADNPLGWKCGQFTSVSVLYFSAICVPSLYSKGKGIGTVKALCAVWESPPNMKILMMVTFLGI